MLAIVCLPSYSFADQKCGLIIRVNNPAAKVFIDNKLVEERPVFVSCDSNSKTLKIFSSHSQPFVRALPTFEGWSNSVKAMYVALGPSKKKTKRRPANYLPRTHVGSNRVLLHSTDEFRVRNEFQEIKTYVEEKKPKRRPAKINKPTIKTRQYTSEEHDYANKKLNRSKEQE